MLRIRNVLVMITRNRGNLLVDIVGLTAVTNTKSTSYESSPDPRRKNRGEVELHADRQLAKELRVTAAYLDGMVSPPLDLRAGVDQGLNPGGIYMRSVLSYSTI